MFKSIQQFEEFGVKKFGKVLEDFVKQPEKQAEFVYGVTDAVVQIEVANKKQVDYLFIDADEDHVSLQYLEQKGDIVKPRSNTSMPKYGCACGARSYEYGTRAPHHLGYCGQ